MPIVLPDRKSNRKQRDGQEMEEAWTSPSVLSGGSRNKTAESRKGMFVDMSIPTLDSRERGIKPISTPIYHREDGLSSLPRFTPAPKPKNLAQVVRPVSSIFQSDSSNKGTYTDVGRHSDDWLFEGWNIMDSVKGAKTPDPKEGLQLISSRSLRKPEIKTTRQVTDLKEGTLPAPVSIMMQKIKAGLSKSGYGESEEYDENSASREGNKGDMLKFCMACEKQFLTSNIHFLYCSKACRSYDFNSTPVIDQASAPNRSQDELNIIATKPTFRAAEPISSKIGAGNSGIRESESRAALHRTVSNPYHGIIDDASDITFKELGGLLIRDESFCCLIVEGIKVLGWERFLYVIHQPLKTFVGALHSETENRLERISRQLVYNGKMIGLLKLHILQLAEDRAGGISKKPVLRPQLEPALSSNVMKLTRFVMQSTSYSHLKQALADLVRPSTTIKASENIGSVLQALFDTASFSPSLVAKSESKDVELEVTKTKVLEDTPLRGLGKETPEQGASNTAHLDVQDETEVQTPNPAKGDIKSLTDQTVLRSEDATLLVLTPETEEKLMSPQGRKSFETMLEPISIAPNISTFLGKLYPQDGVGRIRLILKSWVGYNILPLSPPRSLLKLRDAWARLRREPIEEGYVRIEWKCPCGDELFADFSTGSQSVLNKFIAVLRTTNNHTASRTSSTLTVDSLASPPTAHLNSKSISSQQTSTSQNQGIPTPINRLSNPAPGASTTSNPSFFELCVNTGAHLKTLGEIDLSNISTDGLFFQAVAQQYHQLRGFRSKFWLLKPAAISFVRFSLENRHRVGILQKPLSLPPQSEVDLKNWIYDPCPLLGDPPISPDLFLHYLSCTASTSSPTTFWLPRFPRKLDTSLLTTPGATTTFGWGVHIDEGPDFDRLFVASLVVLVLSGLAAGLWRYFEKDFQGAFGFAAWIVAVGNSLLVAYVLRWKQE